MQHVHIRVLVFSQSENITNNIYISKYTYMYSHPCVCIVCRCMDVRMYGCMFVCLVDVLMYACVFVCLYLSVCLFDCLVFVCVVVLFFAYV